ncbi:hypothetical protein GALL_101210 [mine drainage metagenome]|uniref:HNH endonuclease 5 domain-containing protein n=1 Tax=mine drainage metagenome TaxID=410659 RepID=A0A1J5SHD9_9ZZZZ
MSVCAYCRQDRPLTREHVIPAFMYNFQKQLEQSVIGWNEVAQRMVGGEGKVKDVCADCNNRVLGELDAYGKQMLINSGLLVQNYTKRELTLQYDYSLLLRWLLKVSFNSSRTDDAHSHLFERYVPFMRGLEPSPSRNQVAALLYLARPETLGASRIADEPFVRIANGSSLLNPFLVRICYGAIPGEHRYVLRINVFGPAVFFLMMFENTILPGHAASAIRRLTKLTPGSVELIPNRKVVEVRAGEKSWLDLYEDQVARVHALGVGG